MLKSFVLYMLFLGSIAVVFPMELLQAQNRDWVIMTAEESKEKSEKERNQKQEDNREAELESLEKDYFPPQDGKRPALASNLIWSSHLSVIWEVPVIPIHSPPPEIKA